MDMDLLETEDGWSGDGAGGVSALARGMWLMTDGQDPPMATAMAHC